MVCPYDWARPGGVQAHIANLAAALSAEHDVRVVAPCDAEVRDDGRYEVVGVGRTVGVRINHSVAPVALGPRAARRTLAAVRGHHPDVVHLHEPLAPAASLAAAALGPRPLVGTFHAWSTSASLYRGLAIPARRVAGRLNASVAVSPVACDFVAGALGLPTDLFEVVPNGVDVEPFRSAEPLPELADPERPLVLFVGRLESRKGLSVAVRAWLALRETHPGVRLCVVGDGPERTRCTRMVPGVARDDVQFVGRVDDAELPRYFASADAFVAPALGGESFGVVLLEAMAAGVPVVTSDIPGYRAVVEGDAGQPAGLLSAPGSARALADALERVLGDASLRRALIGAGRVRSAAHDWPHVAARLGEIYQKVVGASGGAP
jgi:phosphatidylinositol alpha-mannosyltransferase